MPDRPSSPRRSSDARILRPKAICRWSQPVPRRRSTRPSPVFEAIERQTFRVSETPHAANLVKLSGNFLIATVIESLGEAVALVSKDRIDPNKYLEILTSTLFGAPVYKTYGTLVAEQKFEPAGFVAPLGEKDIRLALAAAEKLEVPLPIASLLRDRFLRLMANGGHELDWSAFSQLAIEDAALKTASSDG
ncbi:NAD-binding protein [Breoghania sp.]|uniref:NAD-binding protein n=1 Tax=Breoghania sp. TaxID=2065378 RepID=UPI0032048006